MSPSTKIIGVEPAGAAGMKASLAAGHVVTLDEVDKFVDGAAVQTVGQLTFSLCQQVCDDIVAVPEGKVCTTILRLYNSDAIVVEPAGALSIAALDFYKDKIKGKNVVCIVSGSNNDITRMEEIKGRSLLYEGLKHYFIVNFPQRSGRAEELRDRCPRAYGRHNVLRVQEEDGARERSGLDRDRGAASRGFPCIGRTDGPAGDQIPVCQ